MNIRMVALISGLSLLTGCAVSYEVTPGSGRGKEALSADLAACQQESIAEDEGLAVLGGVLGGALTGAAQGATAGALHGGAGEGAIIGVAAGAGIGFVVGMFSGDDDFEGCMTRKGWRAT